MLDNDIEQLRNKVNESINKLNKNNSDENNNNRGIKEKYSQKNNLSSRVSNNVKNKKSAKSTHKNNTTNPPKDQALPTFNSVHAFSPPSTNETNFDENNDKVAIKTSKLDSVFPEPMELPTKKPPTFGRYSLVGLPDGAFCHQRAFDQRYSMELIKFPKRPLEMVKQIFSNKAIGARKNEDHKIDYYFDTTKNMGHFDSRQHLNTNEESNNLLTHKQIDLKTNRKKERPGLKSFFMSDILEKDSSETKENENKDGNLNENEDVKDFSIASNIPKSTSTENHSFGTFTANKLFRNYKNTITKSINDIINKIAIHPAEDRPNSTFSRMKYSFFKKIESL